MLHYCVHIYGFQLNSQLKARLALLRRAIQTHTALTREAATGRGIDRHLLGLQQMMASGESHPLFTDDLYRQSQTWKLSTSGLSAGPYFRGTGYVWEFTYCLSYLVLKPIICCRFGTQYLDGYGINCKILSLCIVNY